MVCGSITMLQPWWCYCGEIVLQIRSATPIQDMNTSAPIFKKVKKLAVLRLFVMTMPIQKAVASGNRNIEFYRETIRSNLK
jgi:hypothetical protein